MAAWHCPKCKLNVPGNEYRAAAPCPRCDTRLQYYVMGAADPDWRSKVTEAGEAPADAGATPPRGATLLHLPDSDTFWVADAELRRLGIEPHVDDVIQLGDRFYEVNGLRESTSMWWLEPIDLTTSLEDLEAMPVLEEHDEPLWIEVELEDDS